MPSPDPSPAVRVRDAYQHWLAGPSRLAWLVRFVRGAVVRLGRTNATLAASGAAFWVVITVVPSITATASIMALVIGQPALQDELDQWLAELPPSARDVVASAVDELPSTQTLSVSAVVSIGIALWAAGTGVMYMVRAVTQSYDQQETRSYLVLRAKAMFGALVAMLAFTALVAVSVWVPRFDTVVSGVLQVAGRLTVLTALTLIFSLFYRVAPVRPVGGFRERLPGALLAAFLWLAGTAGYTVYLQVADLSAVYGAVAGAVIAMFLAWLLVLFVVWGAVVNAELREVRGTGPADLPRTSL